MTAEAKKSNNKPTSIITACAFGTILEWYDFSLYAFLAPIIASSFFPNKNPIASLLLTYSVFAIGFLIRPIGAIFFGHFGDRIGRKKVLVVSVLLMAVSTFLIGLLPTYNQIGLAAPILLIILRISQGIAISGETIGAGAFVIESSNNSKRGFSTALVWGSSGIGMLLSSVVVSLTSWVFTSEQLSEWAWRIPFFCGAITGLLGYHLRKNLSESIHFETIKATNKVERFPLIEAIKSFKMKMLVAFGMYALCAIPVYLIFVFMPVYASKTLGLQLSQVMTINSLAMFCMVMLIPVVGYFSDIFGRKKFLLTSAIAYLLLAYPLCYFIVHGALLGLIISQFVFAFLVAGFNGAITSAVLEMFPSQVRYSASAFVYNLSYAIFGGTTPIIAVYLINRFDSNAAPSLYLIFGAVIAIIAIIKLSETYKAKLL